LTPANTFTARVNPFQANYRPDLLFFAFFRGHSNCIFRNQADE
jgi:hypothetical protein